MTIENLTQLLDLHNKVAIVTGAGMGIGQSIARAVYFLVSGLSDYITGSLLVVDGGYMLI